MASKTDEFKNKIDLDIIRRRNPETLLIGGVAVVLLVVIGAQYAFLVWGAFWSKTPGLGGHFTTRGFSRLAQPIVVETAMNSLIVATGGTVLALVLGVSAGILATKTDMPGRNLIAIVLITQYMVPSFLLAIAWGSIGGPNGVFSKILSLLPFVGSSAFNIYSVWGIVLVTGTHYAGLVYLFTSGVIGSIPTSLEDQSRVSGASPVNVVRTVVLPLSLPAISIAAVLIFSRLFQSFGAPLILGSRSNTFVLATLMFFALEKYPPDFNIAAILGLIILAITIISFFVRSRIIGDRKQYQMVEDDLTSTRFTLQYKKLIAGLFFFLLLLIFVIPYLSLILASFQQAFFGLNLTENVQWTLNNYQTLFFGIPSERFWTGLFNSLIISTVGAFLGMVVASFASYAIIKRDSIFSVPLDYLTLSTLVLPGIVVGTTFLWFFLMYNFLGLLDTIWIIMLALTVRFLVYGTRATNSAFMAIDDLLEDAAKVSGASTLQRIKDIYWPFLKPGFASGYTLLFIDYMKVLSIPTLLGGSGNEVLQVMIWNFWTRGDPEIAAATSTIMLLLILSAYLLASRLLGTDIRELV